MTAPAKKPITLRTLKAELARLDPELGEGEPGYHAALVMLAALKLGPYEREIADFVGYPLPEVRTFGKRLRAAGIWSNGQTHSDWFGKVGGVAFWLDVNVALGLMKRSPAQGRSA